MTPRKIGAVAWKRYLDAHPNEHDPKAAGEIVGRACEAAVNAAVAAERERAATVCDAEADDAGRAGDGEAMDSILRGHWRRVEAKLRECAAAIRAGAGGR